MTTMKIDTKQKRQVVDITDRVAAMVASGTGVLQLFATHTTAALTIADLDPGTDLDFLDFLTAITPSGDWRHPHDPAHAPDHFLSSLISPAIAVPYADGQLLLGTWQRIVVIELDGPRERNIVVQAIAGK